MYVLQLLKGTGYAFLSSPVRSYACVSGKKLRLLFACACSFVLGSEPDTITFPCMKSLVSIYHPPS